MNKLRILLLSPKSIRQNPTGVELNVLHVAKHLQKAGHSVQVWSLGKAAWSGYWEGIYVREFPGWAPGGAYYFSWPLYRELKHHTFDIVHANGYNNLVSVSAVLAKKPGQKLVLTLNSSGSSTPFRAFLQRALIVFYRVYKNNIDRFVGVSKWECNHFEKNLSLLPGKMVHIPNGIEIEAIRAITRAPIPHHILSVGRLVKNKGMHRLIQALPIVREKFFDAHLEIVGDGPERFFLEKMASQLGVRDAVTFTGSLGLEERKKLFERYRSAHVFALLSNRESQGIVFGEALAAGLPILVFDAGVMNEYVAAGCAKGVVHPDDPREVGEALMLLFDAPSPSLPSFLQTWKQVGIAVERMYKTLFSDLPRI